MVMVVMRVEEPIGGEHPLTLFRCNDAGERDPAVAAVSGALAAAELQAILAIEDAMEAGVKLFEVVTASPPGAAWKALDAKHPRELRTMLNVVPVDLRRLPWEAMQDGGRFVFALQSCAFGPLPPEATPAPAAAGDPAQPPPATAAAPATASGGHAAGGRRCCEPLRVMLVVGCQEKPENGVDIEWESELRWVRRALLRLGPEADEEVLLRPQIEDIGPALARFEPHILHFIGHGGIDAHNKPALEVWSEKTGKLRSWDATQIALSLATFKPRVVFLNACRSAGEEGVALSLVHAFQRSGVGAVVAMSGPVEGEAAALAAKHAYEALALGKPLDDAVREARLQLASRSKPDWWRPRLLVSSQLFGVLPAVREEGAAPPPSPPVFVDRKPSRRELLAQIEKAATLGSGAVLTIVGEKGTGKTELMRWCLEACAVRGHLPIYVDLRRQPGLDTLDVLDAIRTQVVLAFPAATTAFRAYLWSAEHLRNGREVPPLADTSAVPERVGGTLAPGDENMVPRIFAAFREALSAVAAAHPVVLGLDHPEDAAAWVVAGHLTPHLLDPIRKGELRRVNVFTATTRGRLDPLKLSGVSQCSKELESFAIAEWRALAEDLVCVAGLEDDEEMIEAFERTLVRRKKPWMPSYFNNLIGGLDPDRAQRSA